MSRIATVIDGRQKGQPIEQVIAEAFTPQALPSAEVAAPGQEQPVPGSAGMAPADKQFFLILSDMSKYILGSLATLLAVKGKDAIAPFVPPGLSTAAEREDKPKVPPQSPTQAPIRMEPTIAPMASAGYNGKAAPEQPPHPEIT